MSKRSISESKMADEFENEDDYEMDYRRLKDNHLKAGYVEGLQAGEESTLQQGFNEGFTRSFTFASEFSKLSGSMSAVLSFLQSKHSNKNQDYSGLIKEIIKLKAELKALEQQALVGCEKNLSQQNDQGTKSDNGDHRNYVANLDSSSSSVGDTDTYLSKKKETCCQSDNCCGKDSGTQLTSGGTSTHSEDDCCKNTDETLKEAIKEGQDSKTTKSNDNSSFDSEMERIQKHFRSLVEKKLNIALASIDS